MTRTLAKFFPGNPLSRKGYCLLSVQVITHCHDTNECVRFLPVFVNYTPKYISLDSLGCVKNVTVLDAGLYSLLPIQCLFHVIEIEN